MASIEIPLINLVSALRANLGALESETVSLLRADLNKEYEARFPDFVPLDQWEEQFIRLGSIIQAIKHYRQRTSASLRRAKDACDAFREGLYRTGEMKRPEPTPTERW